jgi:hypothetical protein
MCMLISDILSVSYYLASEVLLQVNDQMNDWIS